VYAEVTGYGLSGDAYHITSPSPDGDGAFRSMSNAMKRAGITSSDIDYINAGRRRNRTRRRGAATGECGFHGIDVVDQIVDGASFGRRRSDRGDLQYS